MHPCANSLNADVVGFCVTWHIHMCDMIYSYMLTPLNAGRRMCDMPHSYVWHGSFICVTCLIHTCDMAHSYVWHGSFICVTWLIHTCDVIQSYILILLKTGMLMCDMAHLYFSPIIFIYTVSSQRWHYGCACSTLVYVFLMWRIDLCDRQDWVSRGRWVWLYRCTSCAYEWVTSHTYVSHVTHLHESRHTIEVVTSHIWMRHVPFMNVLALLTLWMYWVRSTLLCDVAHLFTWHDWFICVRWLRCHTCTGPAQRQYLCVWHGAFVRATWVVVHMCELSATLIRVPAPAIIGILTCNTLCSWYPWVRDNFHFTQNILTCDTAHSHIPRFSFIFVRGVRLHR